MLNKLVSNISNISRAYITYNRNAVEISHFPTTLSIEAAGACNLSCVMCPTGVNKDIKKGIMKFDLFKKLVDEVAPYVSTVYLHVGGEGLLNNKLPQMIQYLTDKGIATAFHTNAILLNEDNSRKIIKAGLKLISFSMDGYDEEHYQSVRIGGSYELALKGIKTFLEMKKKLGSKTPYAILQTLEFGNEKYPDYDQAKCRFIKEFEGLPLDQHLIKKPSTWGNALLGTDKFIPAKIGNEYHPCSWPWSSAAVLWNGQVVPCCQDFFGEYVYGDLNERSFKEIWFGDKPRELRKSFIDKTYPGLKRGCVGCGVLADGKILGIPSGMRRIVANAVESHLGRSFESVLCRVGKKFDYFSFK